MNNANLYANLYSIYFLSSVWDCVVVSHNTGHEPRHVQLVIGEMVLNRQIIMCNRVPVLYSWISLSGMRTKSLSCMRGCGRVSSGVLRTNWS